MEKICLFTTSFGPNRQVIIDYLEKILPQNIKLFLFTTRDSRLLYKSKRVKIIKTTCNKYNSFIELRKFCIKNKIDRVMNLGVVPQESLAMTFATLFTKTDFICFILGDPITAFRVNKRKDKLKVFFETLLFYPLSLFPKKIFVCSKEIFKILKKRLFLFKKIFYVPPTINTSFFVPKNKKELRRKLNINIKDKLIIFVGRIHYLKGSDILLQVIKDNPDKKFILVGKILDKKFTKEKNVLSFPFKTHEELINYYNISDLCLFPSRLEGLPLAPREAMSCGIPAIISNILGSRPIKHAIKTSLNIKEINNKINNFFNLTQKKKKTISINSRNFIIKEYGEESCKNLYLNKILK